MTTKNHINSSRKELEAPSCSRDFAEALECPCSWSKSLCPCASVSLLQQGAPRTYLSDVWHFLQDLSPGKAPRMGQESCVEMVPLMPNLRCRVGVGAPTLPVVVPGWVPRKESLRLDPTPTNTCQPGEDGRKNSILTYPQTPLHISKPVWCLSDQLISPL